MKLLLNKKIITAFATAVFSLGFSGWLSYQIPEKHDTANNWVKHTSRVITELEATLSIIKDAETGQRGYTITGDESYLEPYNQANAEINRRIEQLHSLTQDNPNQQRRIAILKPQINARFSRLKRTIEVRRTQGLNAAVAMVSEGSGKQDMDAIRRTIAEMKQEENNLFFRRLQEEEAASRTLKKTFLILIFLDIGLICLIYYLVNSDIGKRVITELALRQTSERYSSAYRNAPFPFMIHASDGTVEKINTTWQELTGYMQAEISTISDWIEKAYGQKNRFVQRYVNKLYKLEETNYQGECLITTKNGEQRIWDFSSAPLGLAPDGRKLVLSAAVDVTVRKQTEEALFLALQRLNFHIENLSLAVIEWDSEFRVSRWSEEAERIFGWKASEVTGNDFANDWQFVFPDDLEAVMSVQNKLRYGIEQRNVCSNRNYKKNGSVVYCEWYNSTLVDKNGKLVSVLSLVLDVTARVRLETERTQLLERAQAARNEAESANQIKDQFLAVLSHELRSPLNPILGWTKLLKSRKFDEVTITKALDTIERNVKLQIQLIDDLLDVSRILRGKLSLHEATVDLTLVIDAAVETVRLTASSKSIQIQTHIEKSIIQVRGDINRLQQVVANLLTNAVKFTPSGGQVEVSLSVCNSQSIPYAQIQVRDTGRGINPEFLPYVFEHFRQADSSTTRNFGGLGLGLAIVRHLVELHSGTVTAESLGEGRGATFTVNLPLISSENFVASNINSQAIPSLEGVKILIVDDEADTREFLAFLLQQYGAIVTVAESAAGALDKFSNILPNILLSDLGMPETDGYSLIRQIRNMPIEQGGQIPAIALTAFAGDIDKQQVLAAGFNRHIAKPVEPIELVTLIAEILGIQ